jgi:hypothetical protein
MKCALCQSERPLQNSHIIPEFFYTRLYDAIHRFHLVQADAAKPVKFKQQGLYEKLLCSECEQKISRWEKYTKETFCEGAGVKIVQDGQIVKISTLDYRKFRLFLLSLLWRMGVSRLDFFKLVDLGDKHEEILRLALLNENPLEPLQYPCLMTIVDINGKVFIDWISQPRRTKGDGKHCHCVVINGILFRFYVTSHPLPAAFADACISKKNETVISIEKLSNIPFLAEDTAELADAVRSRKQVGESKP